MKLTPRITLIFVLYATALLLSVAWLAYNSGRESLRSATVSELQSTANEKQATFHKWVEEKRAAITILATSPATIEEAVTLIASRPGSLEAKDARERFVAQVQPHVQEGEFLVVMLLDPSSGQVIAATEPSEEGKFKEGRLYFLNGRIEPFVQNVYYSISTQGPVMTAAAPLRSTDGKLLGVLAGRLDLDEMNDIINRRAGLWQTEETFLVNTAHLFITQPRLSPNPSVLQYSVHTVAVDRCLAQSSGTISGLDYHGNAALIVYRWLSENDLCLIVKIDQDEALAPAYAFGRKIAAISGIALLGAIILATLFSRGITEPIRALQAGVVRFGQGELDIHLAEKGHDELGDLAREFNKMSASLIEKDAQLHEYATNLEHKGKERTAAIKQREERYRSLFENMLNGFAYCQMLFEDGRPQDFTYLSVNKAFESLTGLKDVVGKKVSEVIPGILEADPGLIETYGRVAVTGKPEVLETYVEALKMWFSISVYSPQKGYFVAIFDVITERKQAEEQVRESRAKLDAALASMTDAVFISDEQGNFIDFNDAFAAFHKFKSKAECAKTFAEYPDILDVFMDTGELAPVDMWAVPRALRGEIGTNVEYSLRRKDTGETWMGSYSFAPIRDKDGVIVGSVVVGRDITEQKRVEQEIANLSKFPTENPNPVLRIQNDGQIISANKASQELLEMWECEVNGYLPEDMRDLISAVAVSGQNKNVDIPCKEKVYSIILVPITGAGYVNLYGSDITERKKAEQALRESEERLQQIASSLREVIWLRDVQTRQVLYVNPAFEELTGRACEHFYENRNIVIDAVHPDDREGVIKTLDQRSAGVPFDKEHRIIRLDGSVRWVSSRSFPVRNEAGKVYRWASIMEDITERKRAEEELHRTLDDLKRSNAELEQFAYVASHDLQEPLRGIAGLAQLLQHRYQGQLDSRADEYIEHIVDGTQRMQTLINDLLAYSRIGRRGETIQTTDANTALRAAVENLRTAIHEYGATVTNKSLPMVRADSTQLIQLFQNLIGNAIKFRSERPPQIHISVSDADTFWQFSVADNGIGIEPDYFERIFQVFQRLHTRREYKGTGIGLAICKKIIERHAGQIWVESVFGRGSTFYFTLRKGN